MMAIFDELNSHQIQSEHERSDSMATVKMYDVMDNPQNEQMEALEKQLETAQERIVSQQQRIEYLEIQHEEAQRVQSGIKERWTAKTKKLQQKKEELKVTKEALRVIQEQYDELKSTKNGGDIKQIQNIQEIQQKNRELDNECQRLMDELSTRDNRINKLHTKYQDKKQRLKESESEREDLRKRFDLLQSTMRTSPDDVKECSQNGSRGRRDIADEFKEQIEEIIGMLRMLWRR